MGGVIVVAIFVAAMRSASDEWVGFVWGASSLGLVIAALKSRFGQSEGRDWWFGYVLFGTAVMWIGFVTKSSLWPLHWISQAIIERLPYPKDVQKDQFENPAQSYLVYEWSHRVLMILIAFESFLAGCLGGFIAEAISRGTRRREG